MFIRIIVFAALSTADAFSSTAKLRVKRTVVSYSPIRSPSPRTASINCRKTASPPLNRYKLITMRSSASSTEESVPRLDQILSKLTSLFPLFVLGSAVLGSYVPNALNWVNTGNYISMMLAG
jgi:hypothetical protein